MKANKTTRHLQNIIYHVGRQLTLCKIIIESNPRAEIYREALNNYYIFYGQKDRAERQLRRLKQVNKIKRFFIA